MCSARVVPADLATRTTGTMVPPSADIRPRPSSVGCPVLGNRDRAIGGCAGQPSASAGGGQPLPPRGPVTLGEPSIACLVLQVPLTLGREDRDAVVVDQA